MNLITPVILSGGNGTRLWPRSRKAKPKPFLPLLGETSLFQETLARCIDTAQFAPPVIVAGAAHQVHVEEQLGDRDDALLVFEPAARNTAAAIALAAGVIIVSLVAASIGLPLVLRGLALPPEPSKQGEENRARVAAARAAIRAVDAAQHDLAQREDDVDVYTEAATRIMDLYRERIRVRVDGAPELALIQQNERIDRLLRLSAIRAEREEVFRLQRTRAIGSETGRKLTRELANRRDLGLQPEVMVIDECQDLFLHERYGAEAGKLMVEIPDRPRRTGIVLILATQPPGREHLADGYPAGSWSIPGVHDAHRSRSFSPTASGNLCPQA